MVGAPCEVLLSVFSLHQAQMFLLSWALQVRSTRIGVKSIAITISDQFLRCRKDYFDQCLVSRCLLWSRLG